MIFFVLEKHLKSTADLVVNLNKKSTRIYLSALFCLLSFNSSQAMTVYKTVGSFGETKYSQFAPQANEAVDIMEVNTYHASPQTKRAKPEQQPKALATQRLTDTKVATPNLKPSSNPAEQQHLTHQQLCQQKQLSLEVLQQEQAALQQERITDTPNNQDNLLTAAKIASALQQENLQLIIAQYCS